jgi:hypothetical protein
MASSALTLERAYSVCGSSGDCSSTTCASETPYMMHEEENSSRRTPASRASSARRTEAWKLISSVQPSLRLPIGSLESAPRWTTASKPSRSSARSSRRSRRTPGTSAGGTSVQLAK